MQKIIISADSTCDLGSELISKYDFKIIPFIVNLGEKSYKDGVDITPGMIYDYVEKTKKLPKTAAASVGDHEEFFAEHTKNCETLIHFSISTYCSVGYQNALIAQKEFGDKVIIIDTAQLSTGNALNMLHAHDLMTQGKSALEIRDIIEATKVKTNTSFVVDSLEFLYKGGRCSVLAMFGANLLKLKPFVYIKDGSLGVLKKYRGTMEKVMEDYILDLRELYKNYDDARCFITHTECRDEIMSVAKEKVKQYFDFKEILDTTAGNVITCHCGKNTLGVLFKYN